MPTVSITAFVNVPCLLLPMPIAGEQRHERIEEPVYRARVLRER